MNLLLLEYNIKNKHNRNYLTFISLDIKKNGKLSKEEVNQIYLTLFKKNRS